ncbi:hypothetical protein, partial [Burkholderia ubonensis]|uniref:hypothetical protein n=1 Tax=Burkholderia ubonensis TaxID=101571 RepID=UPI000A8D382D
ANGLTTASNVLKLAVSASNPGVQLATDGLQVKPNMASGIKVDGSGVGINTSPANGLTVAGNQLKVAINSGRSGITLKSGGLAASDDLFVKMMAQLYGANFYGEQGKMRAFVTNSNPCYAYIFGKDGYHPITFQGNASAIITLNGSAAKFYFCSMPGAIQMGTQTVEAVNYAIFDVKPKVGSSLIVPCNNSLTRFNWIREHITLNFV